MKKGDRYRVGFGKPPKNTQFKKGVSGNPKGRPKGSKNVVSLFLSACQQKVQVNDSKGSRQISKLEAAITQQMNNAAKGDPRATREVMRWAQEFGEIEALVNPPSLIVNFVSKKTLGKPRDE